MSSLRPVLAPFAFSWLIACAAAGPARAPVVAPSPTAEKVAPSKRYLDEAAVDATVARALESWQVPGMAVVVVQDGAVQVSKGYGVRKLGTDAKVDADTLFAIASLSKTFAATGLGLLVDEGKLGWDDRVVRHLPDFSLSDPSVTSQVTVRDLLSHRVGLPTFGGDVVWFLSASDRAHVLRSIRHVPLSFPFRSGYGYSNLMFLAAGELFPAVAGQSWEEFTRTRILQPLGMKRTAMTLAEASTRENVATAHSNLDHRGLRPLPDRNVDVIGAAASMYSSANDLARWLRLHADRGALEGKRLLSEERQDELWTLHSVQPLRRKLRKLFPTNFNGYGLGWQLNDYAGHFVARHGGALSGMFSYLLVVPERRLGIAVLTNADTHEAYAAVANELLDAALQRLGPDWIAELKELSPSFVPPARGAPIPAAEWDRFEGTWRSPHYGKATVRRQGEELILLPLAHPGLQCSLTKVAPDVLGCPWSLVEFGHSELRFTEDRFEVKFHPEFIDTLSYTFTKER